MWGNILTHIGVHRTSSKSADNDFACIRTTKEPRRRNKGTGRDGMNGQGGMRHPEQHITWQLPQMLAP